TTSNIRIAMCFFRATRMGHRPITSGADRLRIFPYRARLVVGRARLPPFCPTCEFLVRKRHRKVAGHGVDGDDVAILKQADWPADSGFRPDMADAEAARGA